MTIPTPGTSSKKWREIEDKDMERVIAKKKQITIKFVKPQKFDFSKFSDEP